MEEERNFTPIIAVIILVVIFVSAGLWFFIGRTRIVRGVPDEGSSNRVILVTPRREPTVEVEPTDEDVQTEETVESDKSKDEPTKVPANTPTVTEAKKQTTPTVQPTTIPTTEPTATPEASDETPTPEGQ